MRNLLLHQFHIQNILNSGHLLSYYLDEFSKVIVILDDSLVLSLFSFQDTFVNVVLKTKILLPNLFDPIKEGMDISSDSARNNLIKNLIYKSEEDSVYIVTNIGKLLLINLETGKLVIKDLLNNIDSVNSLVCLEVSPNLERVVIVRSDYKLALMDYDFNLKVDWTDLDDGDLSSVDLNEKLNSASISWRGDSAFFCVLYSIGDKRKCLIRDIKLNVFKGPARADNKVVFSVSEAPINNLSNFVSWQGSLIAFFQEGMNSDSSDNTLPLDKKAAIVFSEKNGLRHGEFCLGLKNYSTTNKYPREELKCKALRWNMDMPLLATCIETPDKKQKVCIYYRSNYEWSLKYSYDLPEGILALKFSDFHSLRMFVLTMKGKLLSFDFSFEYTNLMNSNGSVAVVSGNSLKITPLGRLNIPPPMCHKQVGIQVNSLISTYRDFIFILSEKSETELSIDAIDTRDKTYTIKNLFVGDLGQIRDFNSNKSLKSAKGFIFFRESNTDALFILDFPINDVDDRELLIYIRCQLEETIMENGPNEDFNYTLNFSKFSHFEIDEVDFRLGGLFSQSDIEFIDSKKVKQLTHETDQSEQEKDDLFFNLVGVNVKNSNTSSNIKVDKTNNLDTYFHLVTIKDNQRIFNKARIEDSSIKLEDTNIFTNFDVVKSKEYLENKSLNCLIYLTKNNRLFLDNKLVALDVTSFEIFKHFLLFTQSSNTPYNTLHILEIKKLQNINNPLVPDFNSKSFNLRTIERGAVLVTVSGINVTLQMPRGNLETIYPRLIVLDYIRSSILCKNYKIAFEYCRKHKINMNFIFDVDPELFLSNVDLFISSLNSADFLNLFLNNLENSLCEEILQIDPDINARDDLKKQYIINKVNKVCEEIRKVCMNKNQETYMTTILHSFTKKNPPEYLPALKLVQNCRKEIKASSLEYLCWVVNADTLFDFALKTYDFELVIMVAKHTQKDPKEYLQYLKSLQSEEEVRMKFRINMDLKHYSDALCELAQARVKYFPECLDLIKKHNLYDKALNIFETEPELLNKIYEIYGDFLKSSGKNMDAAWAYYRAGLGLINLEDCEGSRKNHLSKASDLKTNAMNIFIENGCVIETITLQNILKPDNSYFNTQFLCELVDICTAANKFNEVEKVYLITINFNKEKIEEFLILRKKIIDSFIQLKKYQTAYFVFNSTLLELNNNDHSKSMPNSFNKDKSRIELDSSFKESLKLNTNLKMNELNKNLILYEEKNARLVKVQHLKRTQPHLFLNIQQEDAGDTVSDSGSIISTSSKNSKGSKSSKKSKMTKKTKTKISQRKIKEGSPIEEEYLIEVINELKLPQDEVESLNELSRVLLWCGFTNLSEKMTQLIQTYLDTIPTETLLSVVQIDFLNSHPEVKELFPVLNLSAKKEKKGKFGLFKTVVG